MVFTYEGHGLQARHLAVLGILSSNQGSPAGCQHQQEGKPESHIEWLDQGYFVRGEGRGPGL